MKRRIVTFGLMLLTSTTQALAVQSDAAACERHVAELTQILPFAFACVYDAQVGWGDAEQQALERLTARTKTACDTLSADEQDNVMLKLKRNNTWQVWQALDTDDARANYCHATDPTIWHILNQYR